MIEKEKEGSSSLSSFHRPKNGLGALFFFPVKSHWCVCVCVKEEGNVCV